MSTNYKVGQGKHNTTPSLNVSESPKLLLRRRKHRSPGKKRRSSAKLTKDEIKYQNFVHDLQRNIQVYMKECIRESRFDTRGNPCSKMNPSFQLLRTTSKSKKTPSSIGSHRSNEIETIITSSSNRQDSISFLKYNEKKRLAADVRTILAGPAMKTFYTRFIQSARSQKSIPLDDSFFNVSKH